MRKIIFIHQTCIDFLNVWGIMKGSNDMIFGGTWEVKNFSSYTTWRCILFPFLLIFTDSRVLKKQTLWCFLIPSQVVVETLGPSPSNLGSFFCGAFCLPHTEANFLFFFNLLWGLRIASHQWSAGKCLVVQILPPQLTAGCQLPGTERRAGRDELSHSHEPQRTCLQLCLLTTQEDHLWKVDSLPEF